MQLRDGRIRVSALDWLSLALVIVGALNWALVGIGVFVGAASPTTSWNLVSLIFGSIPALEGLVYLLVGVAGLYELYFAYQLYGSRRMQPRGRGTPEDD